MLETGCRQTSELALGDRWLQAVADPVLAEDGTRTGAVYLLSDITERKRLEEQLRQGQKMAALGQLAAGVAHDFNNLLTAVTGNVSLLLAAVPEHDPVRVSLLAIDQAAWRGAGLTRQLLGFARPATPPLQPTDLRNSLDEVVGLLRRTLDPRIVLEVGGAPDLWAVQADPGQLNQVLMNLCLNARDAMPEGGRLLLEAKNALLSEGQAWQHAEARPGQFVRLRVRDTGRGIPPELLPRVFEPLFTTKGPGKGTGLGLAVVRGIVRQHQGWIECASALNEGTRFDVYLPRSCNGTAIAATPAPSPAGRGSETVLLVDDEAVIRGLGRTVLRHYGYEVLLAEDGEQAVNLYRQQNHRIALVILDLAMPRLSGRDALSRLLQIDPDVRVLLTSGCPAAQGTGLGTPGVCGFLGKPYREQDLAAAVRAALDRRRLGGGTSKG
jgi:signal transduction histidine kinase/CheY-like chemotaxis protein